MGEVKLKRSGEPTLAFDGELKFSGSSKQEKGARQSRYHDLSLYQHAGGWVGSVVFRTTWKGEEEIFRAFEAKTPVTLIKELRAFDPTDGYVGFPARSAEERERYKDSNAQNLAALTRGWENLLSEGADAIGAVERRVGRPSTLGGETKTISARVPVELADRLAAAAEKEGLPPSEVLRRLLDEYLP